MTDSNVDWGQDLKRLRTWIDDYNSCAQRPGRKVLCKGIPEEITRKENGIQKIRVDYFGGGDVIHYLGGKAVIWHAGMGEEPGWYAISATFLQNSLYYKITRGEPDYEWLRQREPDANIGGSILIYKID